jgi:hypothetical protein
MELDRWLLPLRGDRMCPKRFAMVFGTLPPTAVETALLRLLVQGLLVRLLWMMMLPVDEAVEKKNLPLLCEIRGV